MTIYLCPAFINDVFKADDYGKIDKISGSQTFCGFIALMTYLIDVSENKDYWNGVTGGDANYWLNKLVEEGKNSKTLENGAITYPVELMNNFMVQLRTLDNNPSRDRFMHDTDMTALAKITNVTYCIWERTNAIGAGWTYVSDSPKPGIVFPPIANPPPPCLLVHDSSNLATAPTGHYDYIDSVRGGGELKTYLDMPDELFQQAYSISQARRPTAAARAAAEDGARRKENASEGSAQQPPEDAPKEEEPAQEEKGADPENIKFPFGDAVKSKQVCKAINQRREKEIARGACAPAEVFINYFTILGLEQPKQWDDKFRRDVLKAYRKLSLKVHPDKQSKASKEQKEINEARFKCISEAYAVLSDEALYKRYMVLMPLCLSQKDEPNEAPPKPPQGEPKAAPQQQPQGQPQGQPQAQPQGQPQGQPQAQPEEQAQDQAGPQSAPQPQPQAPPQSNPESPDGSQDQATSQPEAPGTTLDEPGQEPSNEENNQEPESSSAQTAETQTSGVSTKSTTTRMPNGDVEVSIRVKIPKDAQFSINGNAGSPTETVMRGLVDNINQSAGTKKKRSRRRKQTRKHTKKK